MSVIGCGYGMLGGKPTVLTAEVGRAEVLHVRICFLFDSASLRDTLQLDIKQLVLKGWSLLKPEGVAELSMKE